MKNKLHKTLTGGLVAAILTVGMLMPVTSHAFLINSTTDIGDQFTINYLLANGAKDPNGNLNNLKQNIEGTALFTLATFDTDSNFIELSLKLKNNTADKGKLVGWQKFAFATSQTATSVSFQDIFDGEFVEAKIGADKEVQNAVGGKYLDIQTEAGNGAPRILLEGEMDQFVLTIHFDNLTGEEGVNLVSFSTKWQTGLGSFEFGDTEPSPPATVPEPSILVLLGLSIITIGFNGRPKKRI